MQDEAEAGQPFQDEHDEEFNAAEWTDPRFLPVDGNSSSFIKDSAPEVIFKCMLTWFYHLGRRGVWGDYDDDGCGDPDPKLKEAMPPPKLDSKLFNFDFSSDNFKRNLAVFKDFMKLFCNLISQGFSWGHWIPTTSSCSSHGHRIFSFVLRVLAPTLGTFS